MTQAQREAATANALVARAQAGDALAFTELVRRYRPRIYALALAITGNAAAADDIAQDVFTKAFTVLHKFEGRSAFFTWVYRMAMNRALNERRVQSRREAREVGDDPRLELAVATDSGGDPARAAMLRERYRLLLAALDALPADLRMTVILVALQGLSHGEVAVVQKVSEGTIAWRMHEARNRLMHATQTMRVPTRLTLSGDFAATLQAHGLDAWLHGIELAPIGKA